MALEEGGTGTAAADVGGAEPSGIDTAGPGTSSKLAHALRERYLVRKALRFAEVPYHVSFGSFSLESEEDKEKDKHPGLAPFLKSIVDEARSWDIANAGQGWRQTGTHTFGKKSRASGIEVGQYAKEISGDTWFARHSKHEDVGGTTWEVLDQVLRVEHSKHEGEYTPNVFGTNTILRWDVDEDVEREIGLRDAKMEITNMYHGIPAPLNDRVFTVLLVSGVNLQMDESLVVQLPVDLNSFPEVVKQKCHHRVGETQSYHPPSEAVTSHNKAKVGKSLVQGEYASVEKVTRRGEQNHWVMGTTSNAKGVLPMWVQKKAVPGEIVKDVEYVYEYIEKHRGELVRKSGA